ncbi:MAG: acyl-CoA/acyl-ACP dehydrogenase [Deltaproteobacteria bacterium]|nr:acyl-CoA/acyl-ACP dehydrogenase [Deltaproteobacteria bacterium]
MFDHLLTDTQKAYRDEIRELVAWVPRDLILAMDRDEVRFPKDFLQEAGRRRLLGVRYPKGLGGRELDWVASCVGMEEVGTLGYIFACVFGVGAELVCDAVVKHGTPEQQQRYVVPLLKGEKFAAECLTEPRGGSDFFGATTTAEEKDDHFLLNGQKRFIVGAEGADYFLVYARTDPDPEAKPHEALTCFLVDRGEGVEVSYLYGLMGCRGGGTGRLTFQDVKVPKENVVGRIGGAYEVFNTMMIPERLGTAAMTIGAARPALEIATRYTTRRKAFGRPVARFQGVSFQIAESAMLLDASRALVHATATAVDAGESEATIRRMVSETKRFVTESCQQVSHHAMQVMGGIAYTDVYPVERTFRDLRLASIWTGTNEVMSTIVAHEWYASEAERTGRSAPVRDHEADAIAAEEAAEKHYG